MGTTAAGSRWGRDAPPATVPLLLLGLAVTTGAASVVPQPLLVAGCLLMFGLCAGPLGLRCFVALDTSVPGDARTTAVTLVVAAGLAATSAGAALAGWLIDADSPAAPLVLAAAVLCSASGVTWASARRNRS